METPQTPPPRSQPASSANGARRRPSGEPPPLPRPVSRAVRLSGVLVALTVVLWLALDVAAGLRAVTEVDLVVLRALADLRWDPLTDVASGVVDVAAGRVFELVAWTVLVALVVARRVEHLLVTLLLLLAVPLQLVVVREWLGRMRPAEVEILAGWEGYAHPSRPVTELALILTIGTLVAVPRGDWRRRAATAAALVLAIVVLARLYTAVDHPSDVVAGLALGLAAPVLALRMLTPEEAFPVTYRRGGRAHLDVGGRRGEAVRAALADQLDVHARAVEPFSWEGSAGSTPLRITTAGGALFAKLYALVHLRSDRWYKLARTVRYGRLEDESPFNSVRRLVEYEDHMLRVFRDAGAPVPAPLGIVEITPEREYLLVTELVPGARELTERGPLPDEVVDDALGVVRRLWDAGLAHRDIKPANVLVADGRVHLVDLAFAEVRPSPWRQAVDLANMMLSLALHVPPAQVYEASLRWFTPDEVAEAFAATRTVTVPSQLRALLRERSVDLTAAFRDLAPARPPVSIQRWTLRRAALTLAVAFAAVVSAGLVIANLTLAGLL